jgi:hypothetical protein
MYSSHANDHSERIMRYSVIFQFVLQKLVAGLRNIPSAESADSTAVANGLISNLQP